MGKKRAISKKGEIVGGQGVSFLNPFSNISDTNTEFALAIMAITAP